jgi:hypothetical protein
MPRDLRVDSVIINDQLLNQNETNFLTGTNFELTWQVDNIGDEALVGNGYGSSHYEGIYLSNDDVLDNEDYLIADFSAPLLEGNSGYSTSYNFTLDNAPFNNGYLIFATDIYNEQNESDETNNYLIAPVSLEGSSVDLTIGNLSYNGTITPGEYLTVNWTVTNQGSGSTNSNWYDRIYISNDDILDDNDSYVSEFWNGSIISLPFNPGDNYNQSEQIYIPTNRLGQQYLLFVTDNYDYQTETNENNNVAALSINIDGPDLNPTAFNLSTNTIGLGGNLNVSWTVNNQGTLSIPSGYAWYDSIYISEDTTFDASDRYIRDIYRNENTALNPNDNYTFGNDTNGLPNYNITIPNNIAGGNQYLLLVSDRYNYISETNEDNNVIATPLEIIAPDLVVTDANLSSNNAVLGQTINVNWTITNQGNASNIASNWYDYFYISDDTTLDGSDTYITSNWTGYLNSFNPNDSYNRNINLTIPNTGIGDRYLLVVADRDNYQGESNEGNNVYALPIALSAPDLIVSAANSPGTGVAGETIALNWTVTNQGNVSTQQNWYDYIYISTDEILDGGDRSLNYFWTGGKTPLTPGGSYSFTNQNVTLPGNLTAGNYYLLVYGDRDNYQGERNETNNLGSTPITVTNPDLIVSDSVAPTTAILGTTIDISWTVTNQGNVNAVADRYDRIYLSRDNILDGNDISLRDVYSSRNLAANGSETISTSVTLSGGYLGANYLLFLADSYNYQAETNENNNLVAVEIDLIAPPIVGTIGAANGLINGTLSNTDVNNPTRSGRYSDDYALTDFTVGEEVTLTLTAPFDAYLQLIDGNTQQVIAQDDDGGGNLNSRIRFTPQNNINYTVRATSYSGGVTGNYTLTATSLLPDLVVETVNGDNTATIGSSLPLTWRVRNQGNGTAGLDWSDYFYLSNDDVFDGSDVQIGSINVGDRTPLAPNGSYELTYNVTIPNTATGNRYLLVRTNGNNYQPEIDSNNNFGAIPLNITAPNLNVTAANASLTSVALGQSLDVSWTVSNQGSSVAAADWYDYIYLSDDTNLDGGDTFIAYQYTSEYTPLTAGDSYTISRNITIPQTSLGNRYLLFVADRDNYQGETNENDNIRALGLTITAPDLIVVPNSIVAPSNAALGETVSLSWMVKNQGTSATGNNNWTDYIYLSSDAVLDANDTLITSRTTNSADLPLGTNSEYEASLDFTIPNNIILGDRYLIVKADGSNSQGETDENNNNSAIPISLGVPDLTITVNNSPTAIDLGENITLNWTVTNQGNFNAASNWVDGIYLSNDGTLDNNDLLLYSQYADTSLNPTTSYNKSAQIALTNPNLVGEKYLIFGTDIYNYQAESNNNNNLQVRPVTIKGADLELENIQISNNPTFGSPVSLSWKVSNIGDAAAAVGRTDLLYLSRDNQISGDDVLLVSRNLNNVLTVGGNYTETATVTLPLDPTYNDGEYYILGVTDVYNSQIEIDNNNNSRSQAVNMVVPPIPDLTVTQISAPAREFSGRNIQVNWQIINQGNKVITNGTWYDNIYLSTNNIAGDSDDVYFGSYQFTGNLGVGQGVNRSQEITLPIDWGGERYIVVRTDSNNQIYEHTGETNNASVSINPIEIELSPFPNLQVTQITPPTTAFSNAQTVVSWQVTNTGTGATNATYWYDQVWLSQDEILDSQGDYYLGTAINPGYLNPGQSYNNSLTVTLPRSIDGNWRFIVASDTGGFFIGSSVYEYDNENDNVSASTLVDIQLTPPPDLRVTRVNIAPSSPFSGQKATVSWTVKNVGTGRTLPGETRWVDELLIAKNTGGTSEVYNLGRFERNGGLDVNGEYSNSQQVDLPIGVWGDYFFIVNTDVNNSVYESAFEDNNSNFLDANTQDNIDTPSVIQLTPPPDLTVDSVSTPANAVAGKAINITYRISNQGATPVPARTPRWTDRFYLSTTNSFDRNNAISLGSRDYNTNGNIFDYGSFYNATASITLPQDLAPGNYYVFVVTDDNQVIFEQDDVDAIVGGTPIAYTNVKTTSTPITVVSRPADLIVSNVSATNLIAGKTARINWSVLNQGTGDTNSNLWSDRLVVSENNIYGDFDDVELARFDRNNGLLFSGGTYTRTEDVLIPFTLAGNYHLFAVTDANNNVYEATNEGNNNSVALPINISRQTPDLEINSFNVGSSASGFGAAQAIAGALIPVSWKVKNVGDGVTNVDYWYDEVFLSTDDTLNFGDTLIGTVRRNGTLGINGEYTVATNLNLPANIEGNYYLIARTDYDSRFNGQPNRVVEISESNNSAIATINITINPVPDLVVTSVNAPTTAISGQDLTVTWTVANNGVASERNWRDGIYLSRDQVLDRYNGDIYLGTVEHRGGLTARESYTQTSTFNLPRGFSGPFYVFVAADNGYYGSGEVEERVGENNNLGYDAIATEIILPPPADLVAIASNINVSNSGIAGQNIIVSYSVENQGGDAARGSWTDTLYLSTDGEWDLNDVKLGSVEHYGDIPPGGNYNGSLTTILPGVTPGDYRVILRSDIRDRVPETNENNNTATSSTLINVDFATLNVGEPKLGNLGQEQAIYYKLEGTAGQAIRLQFDSADNNGANGLYVRYGQVPTRGQFDRTADNPFLADPSVVVPIGADGTYYVMVYGNSVSGAPNYTLTATDIPFSITGVEATTLGNIGKGTIEIQGARFEEGTTFQLIDAEGNIINQFQDTFRDSTLNYVTFDLAGKTTGVYDLKAVQTNGTSYLLNDAITVQTGVGQVISEAIDGPSTVWAGQKYPIAVNYGNSGDTDGLAPVVILRVDNAAVSFKTRYDSNELKNKPLQFLGVGQDLGTTLLRPGEVHSIPVYFTSFAIAGEAGDGGRGGFDAISYDANNGFAISDADWEFLQESSRPTDIAQGDWNGFWNQLQPTIGNTWGEYVTFVNQLSQTYGNAIVAQGDNQYETPELFRELYQEKPGYSYSASLNGRLLDVSLPINNDSDLSNDIGLAGLKVLAQDASGKVIGEGISDSDGYFQVDYLQPGNYYLSIDYNTQGQQFFFNQDKEEYTYRTSLPPQITIGADANGAIDNNAGDLFVRGDGPKDPEIGIVQEVNPILVTDNSGVSHMFWSRNGYLVHSYYNGTDWVEAQAIAELPDRSGYLNFQVQAADNLINGSDPGLLVTFQSQATKDGVPGKVYYALGRNLADGGYEFSDPVALTNDTIADADPSLVIKNNGQAIIVYQRQDDAIQDDSDLYYNILDIDGSGLSWSNGNGSNATVQVYLEESASDVRTSSQFSRSFNITKKGISLPLINHAVDFEGNFGINTTHTTDDCYDKNDLEGKAALKVSTIPPKAPPIAERNIWKPDVKVSGNLDFGGKLTIETDCGKTKGQGEAFINLGAGVEVSWSLATLISVVLRTGLAATGTPLIIAGPIIDVLSARIADALKEVGVEASAGIEGKASAGASAKYKDGQWNNPAGVLKGEVNAFGKGKGGGKEIKASLGLALNQEFFLYTSDLSSFDFSLGKGKLQGQAVIEIKEPNKMVDQWKWNIDLASWAENTDPNVETLYAGEGGVLQRTFRFDLEDLYGTNNLYLNAGNSSVLSNPTNDLLDDYDTVMAKDANGQVIMAALKNVDYNAVALHGSEVSVYILVGDTWSNPTTIQNSIGFNESLALSYDSQNQAIAVWSRADSSTLIGTNFTSTQYYSVADASDIVYSIYQNGTWTSPRAIATLPGKDNRVALGKGVNGELIASWDNQNGSNNTDGALQVSIWNGSSWTSPSAIVSDVEILGKATIGQLSGQTTIFWSQTDENSYGKSLLDSPEASSHIYYSTFNGTAWSLPIQFNPEFVPTTPPESSNFSTPDFAVLEEFPSNAGTGGGGGGGGGGAKPCAPCPRCKNVYCPPPRRSADPNDILGPEGFGVENWLHTSDPFDYTIRFENMADATAPAKQVVITQQLDADLDWRSFRLGSFSFGDFLIEVPNSTPFYSERFDLGEEFGIYIDVSASIDIRTGLARWELKAIDPATGDLPLDPLKGFLPPNIVKGQGEGSVTYTVKAKNTVQSGDVIDAQARIVFDTNEPIDTPPIFNTLDPSLPTSSMAALPAQTNNTDIELSWSGTDDASGIAGYDLYLSQDGGEFELLGEVITATEATFKATPGHTYSFYTLAVDNAGNIQDIATATPVTVSVGGPGVLAFSGAEFIVNESGSAIAAVTVVRTNGNVGEVSVSLEFEDVTAIGGVQPFSSSVDYDRTPITVTFVDGEISKVINIPINNDTLIETNETINLQLTNPTGGATLGNLDTSVLTILDRSIQINFSNTSFTANENGTAEITLLRSGKLDEAVSATLNLTSGTATAGTDFTATPIVVNFDAGENSKTVTIPINDDSLIEGNETLNLTLTNPTNGSAIGNFNAATLTIVDDETNLKFNLAPQPGIAPQAIAGFTMGANNWAKTFNNNVNINIGVEFRDLGNGILGQNIVERTNVTYLNFTNALTANRNSVDDYKAVSSLQPGEDFDLLINRTLNNSGTYLDNDGDANNTTIRLNRANAKALGLISATDIQTDSRLVFNSNSNIVWDFNPSDGITAGAYDFVGLVTHEIGHALGMESGVDVLDTNPPANDNEYTYVSSLDLFRFSNDSIAYGKGVIDWTASTTDKYFSIDGGTTKLASFATGVNNGDGKQPQHWKDNLGLGLMDPTIAPGERLQITDLDRLAFDAIGWNLTNAVTPASIAFNANAFSIREDGFVITPITLTRTGNTNTTASVKLNLANGSAKAPGDYISNPITVTFTPGETTKNEIVTIVNDLLVENNETIQLTLSEPSNGTLLGNLTAAVLTIVDNDTNSGVNLEGNEENNTLTGGAYNDTLTALAGNDRLYGKGGNDSLDGGDGNDILDGGLGNDTLIGGTENDLYYIDSLGDRIVENNGEGSDRVYASITYTLDDNLENLTLRGTTAINGIGNSLNNNIRGNSANNYLVGGEGNDVLNGSLGDDTLEGGIGNDIYYIDSSQDFVIEGEGGGIDTINSSITYTLSNTLENLTLTGTNAINGLGNSLNNFFKGNSVDNLLSGGDGNDNLQGNNGNDTLEGGNGNDTLLGQNGNDFISGNGGSDRLTGGDGGDTFVYFALGDAGDTITDFNVTSDFLDISALLDSIGYLGSNPITDGYLRLTQSGVSTRVQIDADGTLSGQSFTTLVTLSNIVSNGLNNDRLIF